MKNENLPAPRIVESITWKRHIKKITREARVLSPLACFVVWSSWIFVHKVPGENTTRDFVVLIVGFFIFFGISYALIGADIAEQKKLTRGRWVQLVVFGLFLGLISSLPGVVLGIVTVAIFFH